MERQYTCGHHDHRCSAGYEPEDDRCPAHPQWHKTIKRLLEKDKEQQP